ncbi:MAG: DNRLRE domain-containing protein [Chloroflexi bacterium]|nr:DNRLRE domain-containing protein [Chloroflexota bacterium]
MATRQVRRRGILSAAGPALLLVAGATLLLAGSGRTPAAASTATGEDALLGSPATAAVDTYIDAAESALTHDGATLEIIGDGAGSPRRAAIRFDLSSIPADAQVVTATLTFKVATPPASTAAVSPMRLAAASTWDATATWTSESAGWSNGTLGTAVSVDTGATEAAFDVTGDVAAFVSGSAVNNGWAFRMVTGSEAVGFHSSEAAVESDRPQLAVSYTTATSLFRPTGAYAADTAGSFEDTYVQFGAPSAANGALSEIRVGLSASDRQDAILRFDLTDTPSLAGATILSAQLVLPVAVPGLDRTLHAARVCQPAGLAAAGAITGATYAGIPYAQLQWTQATAGFAYTTGAATAGFDVRDIVQAWANGEPNLGFRVYQVAPAVIDTVDFHSFNAAVESNRPRLVVEYVTDAGTPNVTPSPACGQAATPTATATPTSTSTATPTSTPTATTTPVPTATPTATATATATATVTATATATSATPSPTATPAVSAQLTITSPGGAVPRSRLAFTATDGTLDPSAVSLVVRRVSDGSYWNSAEAKWQAALVANAAAESPEGTWTLAVAGAARRSFANTTVSVEARATVGATSYVSALATVVVR